MKKHLITILAVTSLCVGACKKSNDTGHSSYTAASLAALAPVAKTVTIDAAAGGSFYGNSGARYIIPANAFRDASGAIVTGSVQLVAKEYLKKSDMLFANVLPLTPSGSLLSGGETDLSATQGGAALYMAPGKAYQVNLPQHITPIAPGMMLFLGIAEPGITGGGVTWKADTANTLGRIVYDGDTLQLFSDSLHLCNADAFLSSPSYQTFTVTASISGVTLPDSVISGYTLYDAYTGLWPLANFSGRHPVSGVFSENHVPSIPVHFAVFAIIDGNFYAGITGATPATGSNYNVTLTPTTPTDFKTAIDAL